MNNNSFSAMQWFVKEQLKDGQTLTSKKNDSSEFEHDTDANFTPFIEGASEENSGLNQYFVPGWKGDALSSKEVKKFSKILDRLQLDAKKSLLKRVKQSRKLQHSIHEEFLSFAEFKAFNCLGLETSENFWKEIENKGSTNSSAIAQFIDIFSFRVAVTFILKVRFILTLKKETELEFKFKHIYYPNSFLTSVFKTGGKSELKSKAFEQNIYSWYRPNESLKNDLLEFKNIFNQISITELIKTTSMRSEKILEETALYSHSLSQKSFGLFLNSLLINFPLWLKSIHKEKDSHLKDPNIEVISCKYAGDFLESMALSHWLAQDQNKNIKWDQILCPDFKQRDFETGLYLKNVNELQFLTFLAEISNKQGREAIDFICHVVNNNLYNRKESNHVQRSFLELENGQPYSTYDRIVLNLSNFPKNNPHFYLINQIQEQKKFLKDDGQIFIITSKKLFVPSQKSKVDTLLKDFKLEGVINLDTVEGRGELGAYTYIFSKINQYLPKIDEDSKKTFFNFRLSGHLKSFQFFAKFTELTNLFFKENLNDIPAMYQKRSDEFKLEFFQDAIVEGRLIHSSSKDSSKITHPLFFQKLMEACYPFDHYFNLQNVNFEENYDEATIFDHTYGQQTNIPAYTLIVDQRSRDNTKIEIINTPALEAKAYEYGHSMCEYFHLTPKWPNIHIESIREYLSSQMGKQVIDLTFNNEMRKVKGNLSKLLIPKFYIASRENMPEHISMGLSLFRETPESILAIHPVQIEKQFNSIDCIITSLVKDYPRTILEQLSTFKRSITLALDIIGRSNKSSSINFNNPILKSPLLLSKTYSIYPDNKEVYIEFNNENLSMIHQDFSKKKRSTKSDGEVVSHCLEIYSVNGKVLTIYSEEEMIYFIEFLLSNLSAIPISQILQAISVPTIQDLKAILGSYNALKTVIEATQIKLEQVSNRLINTTIINR